MSRLEVFINIHIYKYIRAVLDDKNAGVPEYVLGMQMTMIHIITTIWPGEDFEDQLKEALDLWNAFKEGCLGNEGR